MALRLPDHGHCEQCGDPVKLGNVFCSEDCENEFNEETKAAKRKDLMFYGAMAASLVVIVIAALIVRIL